MASYLRPIRSSHHLLSLFLQREPRPMFCFRNASYVHVSWVALLASLANLADPNSWLTLLLTSLSLVPPAGYSRGSPQPRMAKLSSRRWYVSNPLFSALLLFFSFMADAGVCTIRGASSLISGQLRTEVVDWLNVALASMKGEY